MHLHKKRRNVYTIIYTSYAYAYTYRYTYKCIGLYIDERQNGGTYTKTHTYNVCMCMYGCMFIYVYVCMYVLKFIYAGYLHVFTGD